MRVGSRRHAPDPGELRRLAARRRATGDRLRRLLPGVIVGSTTLVGTGALAAWVSGQPGVAATARQLPTRPAVTAPPTTDAVRSLQRALQADETALRSLEAGMPVIRTTSGPPGAAQAATPVTVPAIAPLPQIAVPAAPPVLSSPAPAVNATTGASHAIP